MSWVGTGTPIPTSSRWSGASRNDRLRNAPSKWTFLLGLGKPPELDLVRLRNALQAAGRVLRKRGHRRVPVILPKAVAAIAGPADMARAATEGIGLSNFEAGSLKTRQEQALTEIEAL